MSEQKSYETRKDIPDEYKWDLLDIYKNYDEWKKDYKIAESITLELAQYKGEVCKTEAKFIEFFKKQEELDKMSYKLYRYPQLARDLDAFDKIATENLQKVQILFSKMATDLSWVNSEILSIDKDVLNKWLQNVELSDYKFGIDNLLRLHKHVLSDRESKLISYYGPFFSTPKSIYNELTITDVNWPTVKLSTGEEIEVTSANYSKILTKNRNQEDRALAFNAHYGVYKEKENTIAAIYNSILQKSIAKTKVHNYDIFLDNFLEGDNIPKEVYLNLINTVKEETAPLKRYIQIRKKILKLEKYHNYDGSVNLIEFDEEYEYDRAKELILESIKPLGEGYTAKMAYALSKGWVDVFETKGKRSGAYSAGVYGVHPYMLLNYNKTLDSVFTLAHELGHTLHTLYSQDNQPFSMSDYTIFVAEVASTFNERLLLDYMLETTTNSRERIALLEQEIRNVVGTFYSQVLFADYEYQAHKLVEEEKSVTAESLSNIMKDLFDKYYGETVEKDELLSVIWSRIPHFFNSPFYVYQYATCFASSALLYENAIKGKDDSKREDSLRKYIELLSSGGNDFPMNQLEKAGVDLKSKETIKAVSSQLNSLLKKKKKELEKFQ